MQDEKVCNTDKEGQCISDRAGIAEGNIGESAVRESADAIRKRAKQIYNRGKAYKMFYDFLVEYIKDYGDETVHISCIIFMMDLAEKKYSFEEYMK